MATIFISYRREDTIGLTGRIFDRLRAHFGSHSVLMDIDSIPFGADFRQYIADAIGQCTVMLVVIGDKWFGSGDAGARRIDDPRDFVRLELEAALSRNLPVIPLLIGNRAMPGEAELPQALKSFAYRNAIRVDPGRDFHHHMDRLIEALEFLTGEQKVEREAQALPKRRTVSRLMRRTTRSLMR